MSCHVQSEGAPKLQEARNGMLECKKGKAEVARAHAQGKGQKVIVKRKPKAWESVTENETQHTRNVCQTVSVGKCCIQSPVPFTEV